MSERDFLSMSSLTQGLRKREVKIVEGRDRIEFYRAERSVRDQGPLCWTKLLAGAANYAMCGASRGECQENPTHDHHAIRSRRWIDVPFGYALLMSHKIRVRQRDALEEDLVTTSALLMPN